jgi:hypothetical protein
MKQTHSAGNHDWDAQASEALQMPKVCRPDRNDPKPSKKQDNFALPPI